MNRRRSKGQSLVESSLVLASFMGLVLGMAGVSELLFVRQILSDRVHVAARWGALNAYDPQAVRNMVLFGTATPAPDASPLLGLSPSSVVVDNPGCPGSNCRISVTIAEHGIRSTEPVEPIAPQARKVRGGADSFGAGLRAQVQHDLRRDDRCLRTLSEL